MLRFSGLKIDSKSFAIQVAVNSNAAFSLVPLTSSLSLQGILLQKTTLVPHILMNSLKMLAKNPIFNQVRFMVDGERIAADDTAEKLGLEEIQYHWANGNGGTHWYPQNTPKWSFLVGKPIVVGYHHFWKPPHQVIWYWRIKVISNEHWCY